MIVAAAERNGLGKDAIQTGILTVTPFYEGDRKKRARSYRVQGNVALKIADFSKVGTIMDESVQEGIADFRSLTYSLSNPEAAKQKAIAEAMRRAVARATVALEQTKQRLGPARSVNVEVRNLVGVAQIQSLEIYDYANLAQISEGAFSKAKVSPPPPPPVQPGQITISANVQCIFQD